MNDKNSHGGNIREAAVKYQLTPEKIIDFSASINPLGPSPLAVQAIEENLAMLQHYPQVDGAALKQALSRYLQLKEENIVLGNGSTELIYLVTRMFYCGRIVLVSPCFSEYGMGVESPFLVRVKLDEAGGFALPLSELTHNLHKGDIIFIGNPNNPTGNLFNRNDLLELAACASLNDALLVVDEAFFDFVGDAEKSMRFLAAEHRNLIVLGSMTKFFALPALRIGYAVASRETVGKMESLLPPWNVNSLALAAGEASLQDRDYIERTLRLVKEQRSLLTDGLRQIKGLKVYPGQANFVLVSSRETGMTASELQARLGPRGIIIRDCSNFYHLSDCHFRVAVRSGEENVSLLRIIREVLN